MRVLGLASYPVQAAATRYRLAQFVEPLAARGITLTIRPFIGADLFAQLYTRGGLAGKALGFLKAGFARLFDLPEAQRADVIMVQREAMVFGPPLIEWLGSQLLKRPLVLDLDDATYVPYTSPTYGILGKNLKWFSKTDDLIRWAAVVVCGNRVIADYVSAKGAKARIIPTVVDTDVFQPRQKEISGAEVVLGWIGTHSTFPYLESIFPALEELGEKHSYRLKIIGSGKAELSIPGVAVENLPWRLEREVADFQSFDIGLYPIETKLYADEWAAGKSGFKAIQYMAVGIPYVASPVGAIRELGVEGETHYCATEQAEWVRTLSLLLKYPERRAMMGAAGRRHVTEHYCLTSQADKLAEALREAAAHR